MKPGQGQAEDRPARKPPWLKRRIPAGTAYRKIPDLLRRGGLHTVCEEALCPNQGECFSRGTATFLILGDRCSRDCRFCSVAHGPSGPPDPEEPVRVAEAVREMGLQYVVITSVTRDDLADGGAGLFARTIREIRERTPETHVEVLVPDFQGDADALHEVLGARPDVLNHNLETVPRLYPRVRPGARYDRSLAVLQRARERGGVPITKSGLMLGLGEQEHELVSVMRDLRAHGVDVLTLGQYLRPTLAQLPVERYVPPGEFEALRRTALDLGFHISFSGIVSFRNAVALQDVARRVPLERMLIETDSPYLAPVPHRGRTNEPAWVVHVAEAIARLRGVDVATIAEATSANYFHLFRIEPDAL